MRPFTSRTVRFLLLLLLCLALGQNTVSAQLRISELMASNTRIDDPQGQADDWIEIENRGADAVDLAGLYLTDDLSEPTKWQVPADLGDQTVLGPGEFVVIWADSDLTDVGLHAGFRLKAGGETVALIAVDGTTVLDSIVFPAQKTDLSYGRDPLASMEWMFLDPPTPGRPNEGGYAGWVGDTRFSVDRGFYHEPMLVEITTDTPDATIVYTLDGSTPTFPVPVVSGRGAQPIHFEYTGPLLIETTTTLRAAAYREGFVQSHVGTQTYLFLADVIGYSDVQALRAGHGPTWSGLPSDFGMDPEITEHPDYADQMVDALLSLPTVSVVLARSDLFDSKVGIYTHPEAEGKSFEWERPASVEMFSAEGAMQLQVDCGLRLQGGHSRKPEKSPKHSFSLRFREIYGPGRLNYPLFGEDWPVDSFDTLHLRAGFNNVWTHHQADQRQHAQYLRDQWMRDSLTEMGHQDALQGFYVHLYLNGIYWGLYNLHERPDADHYAAYQGGDAERLDAINGDPTYVISDPLNSGSVSDGTIDAWLGLQETVASLDWERISRLIDVDSYIDWTLLFHFAGTTDIKRGTNWRAAGGGADERPWRFYSWDAEHVIESLFQTGIGSSVDPSGLFTDLRRIEAFRVRFGDRIHRHLFNDATLTTERNVQRWLRRSDEIELAVIAESARWGDYRRDAHPHASGPYYLYTKNDHWIPEKEEIINTYFPRRTPIALDVFKSMDLYPDVDAPVFTVDGVLQHGGKVAAAATLSMTVPEGTVVYTLDGSDPRPDAADQTGAGLDVLIAENAAKRVLIPSAAVDEAWFSQIDYDDDAWSVAQGGVGLERGRAYGAFIDFDVFDAMWRINSSCYIRIPFEVDDPSRWTQLLLNIRFDDGFVAYLNGRLVIQQNAPSELSWNAEATLDQGASEAFTPFDLSAFADALRPGSNLLAIQGLNVLSSSTDFLVSLELLGGRAPEAPVAQDLPIVLDHSLHVKAVTRHQGKWSALNEAAYSVGPIAESLRISELMYHPANPNAEFIELVNVGPEPINLNLVQLTEGIRFTFGALTLASQARVVVVRDLATFAAEYGEGIAVAGQYSGKLSDAGERLTLEDAAGGVILDFAYRDAWQRASDGRGHSLIVVDPGSTDPQRWSDKGTWAASALVGGSPGY